ncbi:MAG: SMC family ATPase [Gemmatimonadota bacterium]|nr:MAG: SMC family ATPase [Gemmatimonadota bacterium]
MRLIRLALKNFRQHADTEIEFRPGLTGIIGPNGSGKSTILEAIAWTVYGAPAARGTKDTLRFNRAPGRSTVQAELEFELRGERYRVRRTPRTAELYRAEQEDPIAAGLGEVTRQLTRRLGMTRGEFFNTYFTKQKDLQFLASVGSAERARFLAQVLGYERLKKSQDLVRQQRNVLKAQVEELRRALRDPDEIKREREEAEERLKAATSQQAEAQGRRNDAAAWVAELEPAWNELRRARERYAQLGEELRVARIRLERVREDREKTAVDLKTLAAADEELKRLLEEIKPLEELPLEAESLQSLAEAEARRGSLKRQLDDQRKRVDVLDQKVTDALERGRASDDLSEKLAAQETECDGLEARLQEATSGWERDRQDADATRRILRGQAEELRAQIMQLEAAGPDGVCPTCKRALGSEYDTVLELVRGQYEEVVQDGKWHKKRFEQLRAEPDEVVAGRNELARAREEIERLRRALAESAAALTQAATLKAELAEEQARARELAGEIAALPGGYDARRHEEVREELKKLEERRKQVTQLETRLERQPQLRAAQAEAEEEERQIRRQVDDLEKKRVELDYSEDRYRSAEKEYEEARDVLGAANVEAARARGEADSARQAADSARQAERDYKKVSRTVAERQADFRLHNELDGALGELRTQLNDRVRPELSEIASVFVMELTDGRYNQIEIGSAHEVIVLDDGEIKEVISGGEEDIANLVLRLAISQMIADRAGHSLSLLIFDEVFGGLDEQRRESVVQLLQKLQDRFEQIILISHIESIRQGMDQVLRVTYNEPTGTSLVREESPGASVEDLAREDLAALVAD